MYLYVDIILIQFFDAINMNGRYAHWRINESIGFFGFPKQINLMEYPNSIDGHVYS